MLDRIERIGWIGDQAFGNEAADDCALASADELARGAIDFNQTIVAHHDHWCRNRVNRSLPAEARHVVGHRLVRRARNVARHRLLPADPPGCKQPQRKAHHERRHLALRAQRANRKDTDPRQNVNGPHSWPTAVTQRSKQDGTGGGVGARAGDECRRVRNERKHQGPQHTSAAAVAR